MGLRGRSLAGISKRAVCSGVLSLSRFLAAVGSAVVGGLRELFERDLGRNGVGVMEGIGMFDRAEDHYMVIDVDGTVSMSTNWCESSNWGSFMNGTKTMLRL